MNLGRVSMPLVGRRKGSDVRQATGAVLAATMLALGLFARAQAGTLEDGQAAYVGIYYATALRLLKPLAEQGIPAAEQTLGAMYFKGEGVDEDSAQGVAWTRKAFAQGDAKAREM